MLSEQAYAPESLTADDATWFAELRAREFARLDETGEAYLDYTGSALHAERQVREHAAMMLHDVHGNPHSESRSSLASTAMLDEARDRVRRFLGANEDEWEVIFTPNATGAMRLVGEAYPFGRDRALVLSVDNHNSANGLRVLARARDASVEYLPLDDELRLDEPERHLAALASRGLRGLVVFPAQSNFSGVRHPLSIAATARALGFDVMLDAAAYVPSAPLALGETAADFVPLSFYKLFGHPTGIGALVARRSALARLRRPWFSGGTVQFVSVQRQVHLLRDGAEAFEDGTPNFLAAGALPLGFDLLEEVGMRRLARRTGSLAAGLLDALRGLRHRDGAPAVVVYGPTGMRDRGACVALNVLDERGRVVPFETVEERALRARVSVRGGCFCNPGAAERAFGFPLEDVSRCHDEALLDGFSIPRFRDCLGGRAVGAVRMSVGLPTIERDVERGVAVLAEVAGA